MKKYKLFLSIVFFSLFLLPYVSFASDLPHLKVFYSPDCNSCHWAINKFIPRLEEQYGKFKITYFNIDEEENYELLINYEKEFGVNGNDFPEIFIGDTVLIGKREIKARLEELIRESEPERFGSGREKGTDSFRVGAIENRFQSFGILAIIFAGLLDGVNPCAFATIVFFISYLAFEGFRKRETLVVGSIFTLTVFLTYLLIGVGLFKAFRSLEIFSYFSVGFYWMVALVAFVLGGVSLCDYLKYRQGGKPADSILQLPTWTKKLIHRTIRERLHMRNIIIAAAATGFVVSLLESICTGQVYLPTILFVIKNPALRAQAFGYLVLYNLMFIVPLVLVFGLTFFGVSSHVFQNVLHKHFGSAKILLAALFFGLGLLLVLSII